MLDPPETFSHCLYGSPAQEKLDQLHQQPVEPNLSLHTEEEKEEEAIRKEYLSKLLDVWPHCSIFIVVVIITWIWKKNC